MSGNRVPPYVSMSGVRSALDSMLYSESNKCYDSMLSLALIDAFLLENKIPASEGQRYFALTNLLVDIVSEEYFQLRHVITGTEFPQPATKEDMLNALADDAALANTELITWSVLYARYVLAPLEITLNELQTAYTASSRTIRRYQQHGIQRLTEKLIEKEWRAYQKLWQNRLLARIPPKPDFTVGRHSQQKVMSRCCHHDQCRIILVTGQPGVGKTHLVRLMLHTCIRQKPPDQVIWFRRPSSLKQVLADLHDQLVVRFWDVSLADYAASHNLIIVLDDAEQVLPTFQSFHDQIPHAQIIITATKCTQPDVLSRVDSHIYLTPLAKDEASTLQDYIAQQDAKPSHVPKNILSEGVPGKIIASSRQLGYDVEDLRQTLSDQAFQALARLAFSSAAENEIDKHIRAELSLFTKRTSSDVLEIQSSCKDALWAQWQDGADIDVLHQLAFDVLEKQIVPTQEIAENLLQYFLPHLPEDIAKQLLNAHWREGITKRSLHKWAYIADSYERLHGSSTQLQIVQTVLNSRLYPEDDYTEALFQLVQQTGTAGQFELQVTAMYFLAVNLRRCGKMSAAMQVLDRLKAMPQSSTHERHIQLEQARLWIEFGRADLAEALLGAFNDESEALSLVVLSLQCEIYFLQEKFPQAIDLAWRALDNVSHEDAFEPGYIHLLLGRGYAGLDDLDNAEDHFQRASQLMQDVTDRFTVARALSNFAALLMRRQAWERAWQLLKWVEAQQVVCKDQIGLEATRHNQAIVRMELADLP